MTMKPAFRGVKPHCKAVHRTPKRLVKLTVLDFRLRGGGWDVWFWQGEWVGVSFEYCSGGGIECKDSFVCDSRSSLVIWAC